MAVKLADCVIFILYTQLVKKDRSNNLFPVHVIQIAFTCNLEVIFQLNTN